MKAIATLIVRRRFWLILFISVLTVFFATQVRHLKIVIDPSAMLPKLHPNVIGTTLAETLFGSKYVVVVGVSATEGGTVLRTEPLQVVADLTRDLAKVPGVKAHTLLSITSERAKAISGTAARPIGCAHWSRKARPAMPPRPRSGRACSACASARRTSAWSTGG